MKHNFKKKYGQNFLQNDFILDKISDSFNVSKDSIIVEVGAGSGVLTKRLITKNVPVISFEIDESLKVYLDKLQSDNLTIVYKDFLSIQLNQYLKDYKSIYFVANVPYYITTPIINKFIEENIVPDVMVMMVQKEVAERLSASVGTSDYGAISAILNYFYVIEYLFTVSRDDFYPVPNVDSAVIKFTKRKELLELKDFNIYKKLINDAFKYKRKNLNNNLKGYDLNLINEVLKKYNLDLQKRAEDVPYYVFLEISNKLN